MIDCNRGVDEMRTVYEIAPDSGSCGLTQPCYVHFLKLVRRENARAEESHSKWSRQNEVNRAKAVKPGRR